MTSARSSTLRKVLAWCFFGYALFVPITIVLGEQLGYAIAVLWVWLSLRSGMRAPWASPYRWPVLAFLAIAVLSAVLGLRPGLSFSKLNRLALLGVVFALPALCAEADDNARRFVQRLVLLFILGATLKSCWDLVRIPLEYARQLHAYQAIMASDVAPQGLRQPTLFDMGNMRDPQFYMVALCLITGLLIYGCGIVRGRWLVPAGLLNAAAWIIHFKRGAWLSLILAVVIVALLSGRRWLIVIVLAGAAALWPIPQVQQRIALLKEEVQVRQGGRVALWTRIAPAMLKAYPMGMGWRATQHDDFTQYGVPVQKKLNHLHNNVLQIALETGWAGAVVWLTWMGTVLGVMWRSYRWARSHEPAQAGIALGVFGGYVALMFNGMVEYNFGDAEIFLLLNFLMALSGVIWLLRRRQRTAGAPVPA